MIQRRAGWLTDKRKGSLDGMVDRIKRSERDRRVPGRSGDDEQV